MRQKSFAKTFLALTSFAAVLLTGVFVTAPRGNAANDNNAEQDQKMKIQIGLQVAPVMLTYSKKNRDIVGLGSYIVNVQAECNGCHSAGPQTQFAPNGNPYLFAPPSITAHQIEQVNPVTYLAGGRDFGPYPAPDSPLHIYSRNLTPDSTGKPIGGLSYSDFVQIIRTGKDFDVEVHPTCPTANQTASCVPYPFDGALLQIMPWTAYQKMTDMDLQAIYAYLSAIPCIDTVVAGQPQLRNTCPVK